MAPVIVEMVTRSPESARMYRTIRLVMLATAVAAFCATGFNIAGVASAAARETPAVVGCSPVGPNAIDRATPRSGGPLRLDTVYCIDVRGAQTGLTLSPDGKRFFAFDASEGLWIDSPIATKPRHVGVRISVPGFGYSKTLPFAWATNSRTIFGATQETGAHAIPKGQVYPTEISMTGSLRVLPVPTNAAGPLDGLLWVGGSGLAIAEFGTKGHYYRPEHHDPHPSIAMIDGRRGRVLQTVPIPSLMRAFPYPATGEIDARIDRHGRMYAVFVMEGTRWFEWHQGDMPRSLPIDVAPHGSPFVLSADLKRVLIVSGLSATGIICEHGVPCPPPIPADGIIAELRDIATGAMIWKIDGRAESFSGPSNKPTISPDGRYALIDMPFVAGHGETAALLSMQDGHILQLLPKPCSSDCGFSFARDGRSVSIAGGRSIYRYRFTPSVHP